MEKVLITVAVVIIIDRLTARGQSQQHYDQRHQHQEVDQPSQRETAHQAKEPEDE